MARTRSSVGGAEPPEHDTSSQKTPRKAPAARKPPSSASKITSSRSSRGKEARVEPQVDEPVTEHKSVNEKVEDAQEPPRKRRKAGAAIIVQQAATEAAPTAEDRKSAEDKRRMHIGKKFSPGNGQMDYELTAPEPSRDEDGTFHFEDYPQFLPNLSPEEILRQGSFGGGFFRAIKSKRSGKELHDDWSDLPKEWWEGLDLATHLTRPEPHDGKDNKWGAKVGQPYEEWEKAGWLVAEHDARGWFQWYCRFFRGRRVGEHDDNEVGRWCRCAGEDSGRWRRIYMGKYQKASKHEIEPDEETISKGIRQTLNHWGYEPTTAHLLRFLNEKGVPVANDRSAGDVVGAE